MEDWSNDFVKGIETAVIEVEKFCIDVTEGFNHVMDNLTEFSEEITEEVQNKLIPDLDQCLNEILEPILDVYLELELDVEDEEDEEAFDPFVTYVHPTATQNPVCRGCSNYHGKIYGGNLLVCGMHPYGVDSDSCPDWESDHD